MLSRWRLRLRNFGIPRFDSSPDASGDGRLEFGEVDWAIVVSVVPLLGASVLQSSASLVLENTKDDRDFRRQGGVETMREW